MLPCQVALVLVLLQVHRELEATYVRRDLLVEVDPKG
jgi:hypothetical protein